jgi:type IV pilus assembly protein PilY1
MPTVDGIPVTRDVFFASDTTTPVSTSKGWHTILVGALRLGGRGIYALDITDPTAMSTSKVLWEFNADQPVQGTWSDGSISNPGGNPANLGYTFGQPNIGRLADGRWVVLVPGGYFPDCSKAPFTASNCAYPAAASNKYSSLFILDAQTGKLIREMRTPDPAVVTGAVASHGLSTPVLGDYNDDQIDDVAFAGDLDGNLWRFDLSESDPNDWSVTLAYQPETAGAQPITSMPRLFADPATNKFIVVFGTGKYLGVSDNTSDSAETQAVYGIRDLGTTVTIDDLVQQTLSEKLAEDGKTLARGLTNYAVPADKGGWYFNLGPSDSSAGERVVVTPGALFDTGRAIIQTLIPGTNDPCSASIQGAIMVVDAATGGSGGGLSGPTVAGWGGSGAGDTSTVGGRVNNPRTSGSVPVVTTVGGGTVLIPGLKLNGGGVLDINDAVWRRRSWREVNP